MSNKPKPAIVHLTLTADEAAALDHGYSCFFRAWQKEAFEMERVLDKLEWGQAWDKNFIVKVREWIDLYTEVERKIGRARGYDV